MGLHFFSDVKHLRLDIVGFLAILGEGSVEATNRIATLSKIAFLPRLLPAPQALLRPYRPTSLETFVGIVVGVYSGNTREHVNYLAHLIHHGEDLPKYAVQSMEITKKPNKSIRARRTGPLIWAALLGHAESLTLLALSIYFRDGFALIATILLSFLSTVAGVGNKRTLSITSRPIDRPVPPGDIVIKYPIGCFVVIKCKEEIARELYWAPEELDYLIKRPDMFRLVSLLGTLMLMLGVVMLGNAQQVMQICFGVAYVILNAAYWTVAAVPASLHWDTTAYHVKPYRKFHQEADEDTGISQPKSYTTALWRVIKITGTTQWVRWTTGIVPQSRGWELWLKEAEDKCWEIRDNPSGTTSPDWDPDDALTRLINEKAPHNQI